MNLGPPRQCPQRDSRSRTHTVSRRQFFGTAAGLAVGAGLSTNIAAQGNPHVDFRPRPIPGGVMPFGVFIHHFPIVAAGTPLANISEPSQITDFNGFVALNRIRGVGSGTGLPPLPFPADMGVMGGEEVPMDAKTHPATLAVVLC